MGYIHDCLIRAVSSESSVLIRKEQVGGAEGTWVQAYESIEHMENVYAETTRVAAAAHGRAS
jgi:hypothetical protein